MKILYYDLFCGISGDMNLGALMDLGVDMAYLQSELKKLNIDDEFEVVAKHDMKHGIGGTNADVILYNQEGHEQSHNHNHSEGHKHNHDHDHKHNHTHPHPHSHKEEEKVIAHHHHHEHRTFATIKEMISTSDLSKGVKELSIEIFRLIAEAEGKVHGKPMDQVHFHEVGATDSIVDIVGAAICLEALEVDQVMASPVQVGGGFVKCAHGKMPVPAPATAEILKDVPMAYNVVPYETTTPTGAAILKATVTEFTDKQKFKILRVGYGLGNKDFEIPNMTRVYLAETSEEATDIVKEDQYLMACNIDDMSGEVYSYIEEELFTAGALDVYKTPIIMKKGRPATKLSVLFKEDKREALQKILFTQTTTAGLRETKVSKYMLQRDFETITTKYGPIKVKNLYYEGEKIKRKPEYEDCAKQAKAHGVSVMDVMNSLRVEDNNDSI